MGFVQFYYGQSLDSDIFWLATESTQIGEKDFISPLDGYALNFGRKKSNITHVFSDSIGTVPIKVERNKIKLGKGLFSEIKHQSKDSLILIVDKNMRVKFIPLKDEDKIEFETGFWNHKDWTLNSADFTQHFRLLNDPWKWKSNKPTKICLITTVVENYKKSHKEKWNFKIIGGNHLFIKTHGQMEEDIYLVKNYRNESVILQSLSYQNQKELELKKIPSIPKKERKMIELQLTDYKWTGAELIKKASSLDDGEPDEFDISGFYAMDTISFQKKSLANKGLTFIFKGNSKYEIYESDSLRLSGDWKVSDTGKQIVLNRGYNPEDYIDLIDMKTNQITIGKLNRFQVGDRKRDYIEYYYQLKLQK